ncbi:nucleotide-binding protein [Candidatus Woesearchaeota archaeon]|nr:nucleotide-binding protein [Candidatus Woesearchaeota archaeon]
MKKILLDTNFLLIPWQFKVDIFTQIDKIAAFNYKLFVLDKTLDELKKIIEAQKGAEKEAAKIALKLIAIKRIGMIKTQSNKKTDDLILDIASKNSFIVATQDKELRSRLKEKNVKVIILRQKKRAVFYN